MVPRRSLDRLLSWHSDPIPPDQPSGLLSPFPRFSPTLSSLSSQLTLPVHFSGGPASVLLCGLCPLPGSLIHSWRFYTPAMPPPRELTRDIHAPIARRGRGRGSRKETWGFGGRCATSGQVAISLSLNLGSCKMEYSLQLLMRFSDGVCEVPGTQ